MDIKKLLGLSACLGSFVFTTNSFSQSILDRSSWSLSSNRNAADSFFAIDGNPNTRWTTRQRQRDGQYFEVNFNDTITFNRVALDTRQSENDYPREYELQISNDGSTWTTVASAEPDASGFTTINFSEQTASHIRIEQLGSDNRYWWSIHELNVIGSVNSVDSTDFSDSDDWDLNASETRDLRAAVDGNLGTRWSTIEDQLDGQFYEINFNSTKSFDRILLDTTGSNSDYPRGFEVQVSTDGNDYTTVASGTPSNSPQTLITFDQQSAQYLRIEQTGSHNRFWWSIHEMTIAAGEITNSPEPVAPTERNDLEGLHSDITRIADISPEEILRAPVAGYLDSYSVGDRCYCESNFDHNIVDLRVDTEIGNITVREACDILGPGPGSSGRPLYNDIQCGNGPANDAGDEDYCPGRVDIGREGCTQIGPKWNFSDVEIDDGSNDELEGLHSDITRLADISPEEILRTPVAGYLDSYSVGDRCYCESNFDHNIVDLRVDTQIGNITVREACDIIGPGPGSRGRPVYNDIQCGNGPANDAGDEDYCPGRVDIGREGCIQIGPKWNFN